MLLHQTTRLDTAGMIVVALRGRSRAMAKEAGGDADMVRIVDRNAGCGTIPEQVRVGISALLGHRYPGSRT